MRAVTGENTNMKTETLTHAIRLVELLETDLHRLSIDGGEAIDGLISDCAEHRLQIANKLRHARQIVEIQPTLEICDEMDRDEYTKHAEKSDQNALAEYRSRIRFVGYCMCAVTTGVILAVGYIAYQLLK